MTDAPTFTRRTTAAFLVLVVLVATAILGVARWAEGRGGPVAAAAPAARPTPSVSAPSTTAALAGWVRAENARPGDPHWAIPAGRVANDQQLAGYADRASTTPGTPVRLFLSSSSPRTQVRAFRVGAYGGAHARLVWTSAPVPTTVQAKAVTDRATGMIRAPWRATTTVSTEGWPEGLYLLKLTALGGSANGRERFIPLILRSTTTTGRLVLVSATTTQAAYNDWGGGSLYDSAESSGAAGPRGYAVSLDRPYDGDGTRKLGQYELGPIWLAESLGLNLAYLTSADLERPGILAGARGIVSLGHDEYWTVGMRDAVTAARGAGANLAFLGANAAYWRIRFESSPLGPDRVIVGYKDASLDPVARTDPRETTTQFRHPPAANPENSLTGMLYECFPARGDYVITDPGFALFRGTGVRKGTRISGLVGVEIDRAYPIAGTPATLEVVSHSPVACGDRGRTYADSVYFTSPGGAGTFATGTMSWALALRGRVPRGGITEETVDFTRRVTANLFEAMAAGPMGERLVAHPNLSSIHANPSTRTGTGGPVGR